MQSQEQKLNLFLKAINDYAEEQRVRILTEMDEQTTAELSRAENEALSDAYRLIQRETSDVRHSAARELASRELEGRRRLFEQRAEIEKKVFEGAASKLLQFTQQPEYMDYLRRAAQAAAKSFAQAPTAVVFRLREADMQYSELIREAYGSDCEFAQDTRIRIGGLLAINSALGKAIDVTLDGRLESQHDWFGENAELPIS